MKTSQKVLTIVTGIIVALLITSMVVVRNDIELIRVKAELESKYKAARVENFERLDFSANWIVNIRQGNEYKVELAVGEGMLKPVLKNIDGTLYFKVETVDSIISSGNMLAKITTPSLKGIKAAQGTKIHLKDFQSDSICIILDNSGDFKSTNNHFRFLDFKTSGNVSLQLTDDEEIIN